MFSPDSLSRNADEFCEFSRGKHVTSCQYLRHMVYSALPRFRERGSQIVGRTQLRIIDILKLP